MLDGYTLKVDEPDFYEYLRAAQNFWDEMPERAYSDIELIIKEMDKQSKR